MEDDVRENVKQAASSDAAEQTIVKINVPQGLAAEVQVQEEEDLETVLANLEFLARRQGFDTDFLSYRSVDQEDVDEEDIDEVLDELEQLTGEVDGIKEQVQDLDERVRGVENEFEGEDSQLAVIMDELRELDETIDDIPDDVSQHLGELREEVSSLKDDAEYLDDYTASLDEDVEALRKEVAAEDREHRQEEKVSMDLEQIVLPVSEEDFRQLSQEDKVTAVRRLIERNEPVKHSALGRRLFGSEAERGTEAFSLIQKTVEQFRDELENISDGDLPEYRLKDEPGIEAPQEDDVDEEPEEDTAESDTTDWEEDGSEGHYSIDEFQDLTTDKRGEEIKQVIEENQPVAMDTISEELFGHEADSGSREYQEIHNRLAWTLEDEIKKDDGLCEIAGSKDEEKETQEEESEGLFQSVSAFKNLSTEQRADEVKQVIRENQPIGTSGICEKLFGYKAKSGTDAYTAVQNVMQDFRDELEKEKDGRSRKYRFPDSEDQASTQSSEPESETTTEVEEDERPETQISGEPEAPQPESSQAEEVPEPEGDSTDSDRPDLSDNDGRYSLEKLREDEDLSLEAEVLKVFQEYRKSHGPISIPEATKVLFGFRASAEDEEYQAVWNQLSDHKTKDGNRLERIEKEEEEDQFKVFGPFKYSNLYSDSHHSIICTECPLGEDAIYRDRDEAAIHLGETGKADGRKRHNAFVAAQLPQSSWYRNTNLIKKIADRECGNE